MNGKATWLSPKLLVILLVLGGLFLFLGEFYFSSGRGAVGRVGSVLPTFIGLLLLVVDAVLVVIWRVRRDKPSALEHSNRGDDTDARA